MRRGFTLVEAMIGAALLMLLLYVAYSFLRPTLHAFARGSTRADMQQQAVVALTKLAGDVQSSTTAAISLLNPSAAPGTPVAMGLVRVAGTVPPDGAVAWEQAVVVYAWDPTSRQVRRRVFRPPHPLAAAASLQTNRPTRVGAALLLQMATTPYGDELLATDVTRFAISDGSTEPGVTPPLTFELAFERHGSHQSDMETYEIQRSVASRNSP